MPTLAGQYSGGGMTQNYMNSRKNKGLQIFRAEKDDVVVHLVLPVALAADDRLIHPCQHGSIKSHRCGGHIYAMVGRMLQCKGRLHHLYLYFNKAFNSVSLKALWRTVQG